VHIYGPFEIRYYGLVYVVGFLIAFLYLRHLIMSKRLRLDMEELYDLIFYNLLGVLIGSRIIHVVFWDPLNYLMEPWRILFVWEGGMAFHGGLLGVAVATYLFWRRPSVRKKISFARLGDFLAIPAVFILAVGRVVNFVNAELVGKVTEVQWCVVFPNYDEYCRHPQQLYSALKRFAVFGWLLFVESRKKHKDGFVMWNMVFLMGIGRFVIDFFRVDAVWLGMTAGQYLSLVMIVSGAYVLWKYDSKDLKGLFI
jgi:phosphatidylglycerol:prolipoprotein diacylglycerol transferase